MIGIGETSARNESRILRRQAALGEPLKVVGIVDSARRDGLSRDPRKGLVTTRAEHLIASIYFRYHFSARRTGFRIFANKGGGSESSGGTGVRRILVNAFDFKTVGADPDLTDAAFPNAGKESITISGGTSSDEFGGDGFCPRTSFAQFIAAGTHITDSSVNQGSFSREGIECFVFLFFYSRILFV